MVLLHGLGATGEYFGDFYDGRHCDRRVVIVDLLGFGGSLDEDRTDFGLDAHVEALDEAFAALDITDADIVLAAHSMSSAVALTWAERNRERAVEVVLWGPPVYADETAARNVGRVHGVMGRLFMLDTRWAERACALSCMNRKISGGAMAVIAPRWPTEVSGQASRHTWDAYRGSLRSLILDFDWTTVLPPTVPVTIFHGANDPIGDQSYLAQIAGGANVTNVPRADHHVALEHPELLFDLLDHR